MHRRIRADLFPLDTKLEKTIRNLKKERAVAETSSMAEQEDANQNIPVVDPNKPQHRQRTLEDLWRPVIREEYSVMRQPPIEVNNFELKLILITMVQQHQFTWHPSEVPNEHLGRFLRMENTMKLSGVNLEVIKLQLFPFSLRDTATSWFESLPYGSVDS